MDPVTPTGGSDGYQWLVLGYPEPTWAETRMVEAEPFFRHVVHEGLARAGRADLMADLCRDWQVFDAGETTWPECGTGGTRCHGVVIDSDVGPRHPHARHLHPPSPATRRCGWTRTWVTSSGHGPWCRPHTGRSRWRPVPTARWRSTVRSPWCVADPDVNSRSSVLTSGSNRSPAAQGIELPFRQTLQQLSM